MEKTYSILILPREGTQIRRLVFSQKLIRYFILAGIILVSLSAWFIGDYFWMKNRRKEFKELKIRTRAQKERLSTLQEQAKEIQLLLTDWKGLQESIEASLPPQRQSSNGHPAIEELEKSLASLQSELGQLISSVPSGRPAKGKVTSGVGTRPDPLTGMTEFHAGIDIPNPLGTPVNATGDGVVESVGYTNGLGLTVVLDHGQGITTHYAHLSQSHVSDGERIKKGQKIGEVGSTGKSTSPHLHYEVRVNGIPIDPRTKLMK